MKVFGSVLVFFAELGMLAGVAWWGFTTFEGGLAWVAGLGLALAIAVVWGIFLAPKATRPLPRPRSTGCACSCSWAAPRLSSPLAPPPSASRRRRWPSSARCLRTARARTVPRGMARAVTVRPVLTNAVTARTAPN